MATTRHRLLHTLVFSSALSLGACGASAPAPIETASTRAAMAAPISEAAEPVAEEAEPLAETDDRETSRYCEPGWPTTKGARCEPTVNDEGETEMVCCGTYPLEPDADYAADNHRCCVQAS